MCCASVNSFLAGKDFRRLLIFFCKQLVPRSGPTKHQVRMKLKLFDTLMVFLNEFLGKKMGKISR